MRRVLALLVFALASPAAAHAQSVAPPFEDNYSVLDLGLPPGYQGPPGGLTIKAGDTSKLLVGGAANTTLAKLYEVGVVRDAEGHITGFSGSAAAVATAPSIDGGLAYGPGDVLFYSRFPENKLGEIRPGSATTGKVVDLGPLGVAKSTGGLEFVPAGFPGAGSLKITSYNGNTVYDAGVTADASGTYSVSGVTAAATLSGNPEGLLYVKAGKPEFAAPGALVNEAGSSTIAAFQLDLDGNPVPASRRAFITGLDGPEGAAVDPVTGDFLFTTFGVTDRILVVRGYAVDPCSRPAAITDNDGQDTDPAVGVVSGTSGADVVCGGPGDDRLNGLDGNDRLYGKDGRDILIGGAGADTLDGGARGDVLQGDLGPDIYLGGFGVDTARYGPTVTTPLSVDMSSSNGASDGRANERDSVGADIEKLEGGAAADTLIGNALGNTISGGAGDDQISGRGYRDALRGQDGFDTLTGNDDSGASDILDCGPGGGVARSDGADVVTACG